MERDGISHRAYEKQNEKRNRLNMNESGGGEREREKESNKNGWNSMQNGNKAENECVNLFEFDVSLHREVFSFSCLAGV